NDDYFRVKGFEADDMAASLAKDFKSISSKNFELVLATVDSDWQQLVSDRHNILWSNLANHPPLLRSESEVLEHTARTTGYSIQNPEEIAKVKHVLGDKSDNISDDAPIGIISLSEPTESVEISYSWKPKSNVQIDHLRIAYYNHVETRK
ncbi:MAG: hypothetical protein ACRC1X_04400, partial [Lactobacillus panisapium]